MARSYSSITWEANAAAVSASASVQPLFGRHREQRADTLKDLFALFLIGHSWRPMAGLNRGSAITGLYSIPSCRIPDQFFDVVCPGLEGPALFVSVVMEIVGAVADSLGLMVLDGIADLASDAECCLSGLYSCPQVLWRERRARQSPVLKQSRNRLPQRIFPKYAILRLGRGENRPSAAVADGSGEKLSAKGNEGD
jgi:hypothetical protein